MSERVRQSLSHSMSGSKRIIVAACAAIAMVLGAMSAGASVFVGTPSDTQPPVSSNQVDVSIMGSSGLAGERSTIFMQQNILQSKGLIVPQAPLANAAPSTAATKSLKQTLTDTVKAVNNTIFAQQTYIFEQTPSGIVAPPSTSIIDVPAGAESVTENPALPPETATDETPDTPPAEPTPPPSPASVTDSTGSPESPALN